MTEQGTIYLVGAGPGDTNLITVKGMALVREADAPEGGGTCEEWAQRQVDNTEHDVLFPRWEARRRAAGKYEVTFTYTIVGEGESVSRRGRAWTADVIL